MITSSVTSLCPFCGRELHLFWEMKGNCFIFSFVPLEFTFSADLASTVWIFYNAAWTPSQRGHLNISMCTRLRYECSSLCHCLIHLFFLCSSSVYCGWVAKASRHIRCLRVQFHGTTTTSPKFPWPWTLRCVQWRQLLCAFVNEWVDVSLWVQWVPKN